MKLLTARKVKALHPISIGLEKTNFKKKLFSRKFSYERNVLGFDKPLVQKVNYTPIRGLFQKREGELRLRVYSPTENTNVSNLICNIHNSIKSGKKQKVAQMIWGDTNPKYTDQGLITHLITEATHLLKGVGVKEIEVLTIGKERSIYHELGFVETKRTAEGIYYTKKF